MATRPASPASSATPGTDRFEVDVTPYVKPGERNLIAVRVEDTTGVAGIWKPVKLVTPKG